MIHFLTGKKEEVLERLNQKKVICFGAGKRLEYFRKLHPQIQIDGLCDNYKGGSTFDIDGKSIPVCFPEEMTIDQREHTIMIITSLKVDHITEQLDRISAFSGMPCYAEADLDDYIGLDEEQKTELRQQIEHLFHRTEESILKENFGEANRTSAVKKFQIWEYFGATNTAGSKAREDIREILGQMGYQALNVHCGRFLEHEKPAQIDRLVRQEWQYIYETVPQHAVVFLQFPMPLAGGYPTELMMQMKREKKICFVSLIHDVDILRRKEEQNSLPFIMELSDLFVVHNSKMLLFFMEQGIDEKRLINLLIFDYLCDEVSGEKFFERSVTIAGNLSPGKSAYLGRIGKISSLKVYLYGPNFSQEISKEAPNICYCGCIKAAELPQKLDRGFGLIWDGSSIDTCAGGTGEYLRYNNPHKMSLYLAAGLPVIIWSGAAQAEFVQKNEVGIAVDSLADISRIIEKMSETQYRALVQNAKKISALLRDGAYTKAAVKTAEEAAERIFAERSPECRILSQN